MQKTTVYGVIVCRADWISVPYAYTSWKATSSAYVVTDAYIIATATQTAS